MQTGRAIGQEEHRGTTHRSLDLHLELRRGAAVSRRQRRHASRERGCADGTGPRRVLAGDRARLRSALRRPGGTRLRDFKLLAPSAAEMPTYMASQEAFTKEWNAMLGL